MIEPSPRIKKEANRIGCEPSIVVLADLQTIGYSDAEAYNIVFPENAIWDAKRKIAHREDILASEAYKRAYEDRMNARRYVAEAVDDRGKDDVLRELNQMVSQERDTRTKADLLMKIAEIKQMKKDVNADSDNPVQFFLPLDCEKCPLLQQYNAYITDKNKGRPEKDWETTLRPEELQRIIEQAKADIQEIRKAEE